MGEERIDTKQERCWATFEQSFFLQLEALLSLKSDDGRSDISLRFSWSEDWKLRYSRRSISVVYGMIDAQNGGKYFEFPDPSELAGYRESICQNRGRLWDKSIRSVSDRGYVVARYWVLRYSSCIQHTILHCRLVAFHSSNSAERLYMRLQGLRIRHSAADCGAVLDSSFWQHVELVLSSRVPIWESCP